MTVTVRVSLGFRDTVRVSFRDRVRVRIKVRVSLDSPPSYIMYGFLCPLGLGLELRFGSFLESSLSYILPGEM